MSLNCTCASLYEVHVKLSLKGKVEYWQRMKNLPWRFPFCLIFNWKYYICTIMWEEFTSVVLVCDLKLKCDKLPSLVSDAETATINTVPHMHICVSVLWTSVFLWKFGDNKNVLLFPTTLLYIRISFSDKLVLKFTVSQQFTSNFFRLQVLHYIFKSRFSWDTLHMHLILRGKIMFYHVWGRVHSMNLPTFGGETCVLLGTQSCPNLWLSRQGKG